MVRDHFYDPDGPFLRIETLRCLNCGETVYPKAGKTAGAGPGQQEARHSSRVKVVRIGHQEPVEVHHASTPVTRCRRTRN